MSAQNLTEALHKFGEAFHELSRHLADLLERPQPQEAARPVPPPAVQAPEGRLPEDGA